MHVLVTTQAAERVAVQTTAHARDMAQGLGMALALESTRAGGVTRVVEKARALATDRAKEMDLVIVMAAARKTIHVLD